jgi:hypothetical protein
VRDMDPTEFQKSIGTSDGRLVTSVIREFTKKFGAGSRGTRCWHRETMNPRANTKKHRTILFVGTIVVRTKNFHSLSCGLLCPVTLMPKTRKTKLPTEVFILYYPY